MTTAVTIRVPPHVFAVIIQFEEHTKEHGWLPGNAQVLYGGKSDSWAIHETLRISCIVERTEAEMNEGRPETHPPLTINEAAHGHE